MACVTKAVENLLAHTRIHHEKFPYSTVILSMWPGLKSCRVCQPSPLDRSSPLGARTPALKQRRCVAPPLWLFTEELTKYLTNAVRVLPPTHFTVLTATARGSSTHTAGWIQMARDWQRSGKGQTQATSHCCWGWQWEKMGDSGIVFHFFTRY